MRGASPRAQWAVITLVAFALLLGGPVRAQAGDIILHEGDRIVWQIDGQDRFIITADKRAEMPTQWSLHIQQWGRKGCDDDSCWGLQQEIRMTSEIAFFPGEQWWAYYVNSGRYYEIYLPAVMR